MLRYKLSGIYAVGATRTFTWTYVLGVLAYLPSHSKLSHDMNALPEDEVPEEIYAATRWDNDESTVIRESAGYVPVESENDIDHRPEDSGGLNTNEPLDSDQNVHPLCDNTSEDPDIVPLEYSGIAAADETQITHEELMRSAMKKLTANIQEQMINEGGYLVRHGGFARDFGPAFFKQADQDKDEPNPSTHVFPHLFPYGVGGLEAKREIPVTFIEHDFDHVTAAVGQLKPEDYQKASQDEKKGVHNQDPRVGLLKKAIRVTMQKVMGTDASRALNHSKIWSTSLYLNPVNLWITLNFIDRHDPICQVFVGEQIDMDDLSRVLNLSATNRAINVAQDPFAATQFFFFLANVVLKTLFGFATDNQLAENEVGELGKGNTYFGAVEAQGRGSLHLHLMMWLANSPDADEISYKLQSPDFREKIKAYMQQNIRSHLDGLTEDTLETMEPESALAWSRPPNPDSPTYEDEVKLLEIQLAHSQQYHKCLPNTCQQYDKRKQRVVCKHKAPFPLSPEDVVTESGEIRTKRLI
ncbi:hypothetical protein FRC11_000092, partial [Ceratobasidium sp. 423]